MAELLDHNPSSRRALCPLQDGGAQRRVKREPLGLRLRFEQLPELRREPDGPRYGRAGLGALLRPPSPDVHDALRRDTGGVWIPTEPGAAEIDLRNLPDRGRRRLPRPSDPSLHIASVRTRWPAEQTEIAGLSEREVRRLAFLPAPERRIGVNAERVEREVDVPFVPVKSRTAVAHAKVGQESPAARARSSIDVFLTPYHRKMPVAASTIACCRAAVGGRARGLRGPGTSNTLMEVGWTHRARGTR